MNIKVRPNKTEGGITLISLIIMIILLVILAAVTIRGVTGHEGILDSSSEIAKTYIVEQYREQVYELARGIILKDSILGKETTLQSMAEEMQQESWIKTAVPDRDTKSIYVTVTEGYRYQVYYDEQTGELDVYPIGPDDGHSIPKLKLSYDKVKAIIRAEASCEDNIVKIELIYKGEIVPGGTKENTGIAEFNVQKTGWYEVKATCAKGKEVYGKIRISSTVTEPNIEVTSNNEQENGWYGKDNREVEVTISTDNETAVGIWYKTNKDTDYTYAEGRSKVLTIKEAGRTIIYAYVVDKNENESEIANKEIKYDNIKPEIDATKLDIKGTRENEENEWFQTNVEISLEKAITDNPQEVGIDGFYCWEITNKENPEEPQDSNYLKGTDKKISVETDGIHMLGFIAKDKAGNTSAKVTAIIKKDSTKPREYNMNITDITTEGFTINGATSDETSGIAYYNFYINGSPYVDSSLKGEKNTTGSCIVKGLTDNQNYSVYMEAVDNAENKRESKVENAKTLLANSKPSFTGTPTVAKVANSNTSLTITAVATDPDGDILTYTLCDSNGNAIMGVGTQTNVSGQGVTFTHSGLGNYSTHTYLVKVTDGKIVETVYSNQCSGTTFCKGERCSGESIVTVKNSATCPTCNRRNQYLWVTYIFGYECSERLKGLQTL